MRLKGLAPEVEKHLQKLQNDPTSRAADHWRKETESWLSQMEALLPDVGKKTSEHWAERIEAFKSELEELT